MLHHVYQAEGLVYTSLEPTTSLSNIWSISCPIDVTSGRARIQVYENVLLTVPVE